MMTSPGYSAEDREPGRAYTPSQSSEEEYPRLSGLSLGEKKYRLFSFRKDGRSWYRSVCSEQQVSDSEIKKVAARSKKAGRSVHDQLQKMSPPRRNAIEDQLERINREDAGQWEIDAIHNDKPEVTKRTGEVLAFSIILTRLGAGRQRAGSASQERRRSTVTSPARGYSMTTRRGSKSYYSDRASPVYDNRRQSFRASQTIMENDPFGNEVLFSKDGKPLQTTGSATLHANADLPPHIPLHEPIGASSKEDKENTKDKQGKSGSKNKKNKGSKDDEVIDLDALLGGDLNDDLLDDHDGHDDHDFQFEDESPIEVMHEPSGRGRKKQPAWGGKTPKGRSRSKSRPKSKPRPTPLHIPKDDHWRKPIPQIVTGGRRREPAYYGSHGSATTPSIRSDESILEGEIESYSSSNSSQGYEHDYEVYVQPASSSRYAREQNYHRRGPPSPQQPRYEIDPRYATRRPRQERMISDNAVARYSYSHSPHPTQRPPLITQHSAPRFVQTPVSAYPASAFPTSQAYTYDSGIMPYPSELGRRRRDSMQLQNAEHYIYQERESDKDREIERLRRERDHAIAAIHEDRARRASVGVRTGGAYGGSRYTHEPRQSQRYTEQYHH